MNKAIKSVLLLSALTLGIQNASAQTCNNNMKKTAPDSRYTNNGDGSVYDKDTDLTWMRCSIGQTWESGGDSCSGTLSQMRWGGALETVITKNSEALLGKSDWRLPNVKELSSVLEWACFPAINETQFPNQSLGTTYWASTANIDYNYGYNAAWCVSFNDEWSTAGLPCGRDNDNAVRFVRGGE